MWCFKTPEGLCIYILPNQKRFFGKSVDDVKLEGDATISRLHAVVSVEPSEDLGTQSKCIINDASKYGTFVIRDKEKRKLSTDDKFVLKNGDIVQFGLKHTTFVVLCHTFVIAKSSLDEEDIKRLSDIVDCLGGRLSESWENSCTHLTMAENILFTTKLACALASAKPIVTTAYWEAVNTSVKRSKELPKIEDFLPKIKEEWLKVCSRLFLPNEKRKTLFKGLSFVHFCPKQYFLYASLITATGGKSCVYPTKRPLTPSDLLAKNAIVIQQPTNDSTQFTQVVATDYPIIYRKLQTVKRRMVSDTEIPLAILYCTTEMYCNPNFDFATFLKLKNKTFSPSDVMIEDTQGIDNIKKRSIKRKIIPETCDSQINENISKKNCFSDESEQKNSFGINKSNIAAINTQGTDNRELKHKIVSETYNFQNDNILKKTHFSHENEQRDIFNTDKDNIAQNHENILKNTYFYNEKEQKSISDEDNVISNIFSRNKQFQIIPETCYSSEKNENNISGRNNNKQIISETCECNEKSIANDLTIEEQHNNKLQEREVFEENKSILAKNNQQKDMLGKKFEFQQENICMIEKNSSVLAKSNSSHEENQIIKKDNLNNNNNKSGSAKWKSYKNSEKHQILSTEKINDNDIYIEQKKGRDTLRENCSKVRESHNSLKGQELDPVCNSARNREDKKTKEENKMHEKDKKKEKFRKMGANWYERYLNRELTDEILRKSIPCGKKFTKMPVIIPKRILRIEDFVL